MRTRKLVMVLGAAAAVVTIAVATGQSSPRGLRQLGETLGLDKAEPVETDMHEFMEYVFEPAHKRLRQTMAETEKDRKIWKAIKGDSLTLAEACNLLFLRVPKEDGREWVRDATTVRAAGAKLYRAAGKKDGEGAAKHYAAMLTSCDQCHERYEDAPTVAP